MTLNNLNIKSNETKETHLSALDFSSFFDMMKNHVGTMDRNNVVIMVCDGDTFVESVDSPLLDLLSEKSQVSEQIVIPREFPVGQTSISIQSASGFVNRLDELNIVRNKQDIAVLTEDESNLSVASTVSNKFKLK